MKFIPNYERVIATAEKSAGNETVGDMWVQTKSFQKDVLASAIIEWAMDVGCSGKLFLTIDESSDGDA